MKYEENSPHGGPLRFSYFIIHNSYFLHPLRLSKLASE